MSTSRLGDGGAEAAGAGVGERIYCYLVEQCLQAAQQNKVVFCPVHGNMGPYFIASREGHVTSAHAAPDSVRTVDSLCPMSFEDST